MTRIKFVDPVTGEFQLGTAFGVLIILLVAGTAAAFGIGLAYLTLATRTFDVTHLPLIGQWMTFLQWLVPAILAYGIGKRAATKADVIDAQTRAAQGVSVAPTSPPVVTASPAASDSTGATIGAMTVTAVPTTTGSAAPPDMMHEDGA